MKHIGTLIDEETWHKLVVLCAKKDTKISKVIRSAIHDFIKENVSEACELA